MRHLIALILILCIYQIPVGKWTHASKAVKQKTMTAMMRDFKEKNPECTRAEAWYLKDKKTFTIFIRCAKSARRFEI